MKKIALVTDSTADLTDDLAKEHDIHIIPLKVRFGNEEMFDHEITSEEFYRRLEVEPELPMTSQPTPEEFLSLYKKLLKEYKEVISIHISSGLSGTSNAANLAKSQLEANIHVVDSKTISLGAGLLVLEAARQVRAGLSSSQIVEGLSKARKNIETLFTVNTLEYLQKGGRIGKVQGLVGTLLNIKPVVRVGDDGIYHTYSKARSQQRALDGLVKAFGELAQGRKCIGFSVAHGAALQAGKQLKEAMEKTFNIKASMLTQVGPTIGVHTGPGTIGAAMQFE